MNMTLPQYSIKSIGLSPSTNLRLSGIQLEHRLWYNYVPSESASIAFLVLFGLSTCASLLTAEFREVIHTIQASYFRMWFLLPTAVLCGFLEIVGWSARLWSSQDPFLKEPFLIQVSTLIFAPTMLVAANFILLGRVISLLGPQYSRLRPKLYAIIFLSSGLHIILCGVLFQLVAITTYCALAMEFFIRYTRGWPIRHVPGEDYRGKVDIPLKRMLYAMSVMTGFIFLRITYRTAEVLDGFQGKVSSNQSLFIVFDATMITLAMVTLNIFYPGDLLQNPQLGHHHDLDPISSQASSNKFNDPVNPAAA
ncbi:hypothetical protein BGW80DRAFT_1543183 [Lactifluus volemus]|nr:hypothetical protein BGW80DRAFT_1543183 [Lactifluus volemus]